jgi:hypothetical protein
MDFMQQMMQQTSSTPVTPSALQKQQMGITSPSSTGTMQTGAIRKSPIGELDFFIVDFTRTIWYKLL